MSARQGSTVIRICATSRFGYPNEKQEEIQAAITKLNKEGKNVLNIIDGNERYFGPFGNYMGEVTILWESSSNSSTCSEGRGYPSYIENTYLNEYQELLNLGVITQEEFNEKENDFLSNLKEQGKQYADNPELKEYYNLFKLGIITQEEFDAKEKAYTNSYGLDSTQYSKNIELREYQDLLELGVITQAEFNEKKKHLIF